MQISPVNNINFNGSFKKTPELERLLNHADESTLFRFNEVLERAKKVKDGKVFKVSALVNSKIESWGKILTFHFHLLSFPENNEYCTSMEDMKSFQCKSYSNRTEIWDNYSKTIKSFVSTLEKEYPQADFAETHSELIQKINKKLI